MKTQLKDIKQALEKCNLFKEKLIVIYPAEDPLFLDYEDELWKFMGSIEANIERNGGYMIDKWQCVDAQQNLYDVRGMVSIRIEYADTKDEDE
ncbi:MAG TPA: hypothetical protein DEO38_01670 [Bacteroidales bacterium]|nr:hypothetical protein [Bacteroidales bacterium]